MDTPLGDRAPQNIPTGKSKPMKQSMWSFLRQRWYLTLPLGLIIVAGVIWGTTSYFLTNSISPLTLFPQAPHRSTTVFLGSDTSKEGKEWDTACRKAGGTVWRDTSDGGNVDYCLAGKYSDAGKTCTKNEDCISNKCLREQLGYSMYCAYATNWNGPKM